MALAPSRLTVRICMPLPAAAALNSLSAAARSLPPSSVKRNVVTVSVEAAISMGPAVTGSQAMR